jgi:hypothetical protein
VFTSSTSKPEKVGESTQLIVITAWFCGQCITSSEQMIMHILWHNLKYGVSKRLACILFWYRIHGKIYVLRCILFSVCHWVQEVKKVLITILLATWLSILNATHTHTWYLICIQLCTQDILNPRRTIRPKMGWCYFSRHFKPWKDNSTQNGLMLFFNLSDLLLWWVCWTWNIF